MILFLLEGYKKNFMAGFNILKWLYKHSPVNFYSVNQYSETIIKSINNTSTGYKYNKEFNQDEITSLRKTIKNFKRLWTISILIFYLLTVYIVIFPHYSFFSNSIFNTVSILVLLIVFTVVFACVNSKFFEQYLKRKFGNFEKVHFPSSNSIENQSYREFKFEICKILALILVIYGIYVWIGSPSETSLNLIYSKKYGEAIRMTTIWSKILPVESKWYSLRGYAKFKTGDFLGAINDYDRAYALENDEFKTMNFDNKIYIKYFMEDYDGALRDFDDIIAASNDEYEKDSFLWDKAQFLYNIGKYKKALDIYNQLIVNSDSDLVYLIQNKLYYERGLVYLKLNNQKRANADFEKAEELNLEEEFKTGIPEPVLLLDDLDENS